MVICGAKRIYDRSGKVSISTEMKEGDKRKLPFKDIQKKESTAVNIIIKERYLTTFLQKMYIGRQNY